MGISLLATSHLPPPFGFMRFSLQSIPSKSFAFAHIGSCFTMHIPSQTFLKKQTMYISTKDICTSSYDPVSQHIYPSRNVAFDESCFPAKTRVVLASPTSVTLPPASPVVISLPQQIFAATSPSTSLLFVLLPIELSILSHTTFPQSVVGTPSTTLNEASVEFGSSPGILWSLHPIFFFQIITCIILPRV